MEKTRTSRKTFRLRLDEMVSSLREEILSGKLESGEFLPAEPDLGSRYSLSNKSVRRGLDILVSEGLIEKLPKVGNRVLPPLAERNTVIRFGYHSSTSMETGLPYLISEFHKLYPHILVQTVEVPGENFYHAAKEYIDAGLLDVVTLSYVHFREFVENEYVDALEPVQPNGDLYPFLNKAFTHDAEQYVQPFVFSPVVLCYNRDHFAEAGQAEPDSGWTWDDLLRCADKLTIRNKRFGFYFHLFSYNRWPIFLLQSGGDVFRRNKKGNYEVCEENLIKGFSMCRDIVNNSDAYPTMLTASEADAEQLFLQGKVSMIMTSYMGMNELKDADFSYDIAPLPHLADFKTLLVAIGLGLNRKSKVKEAARQFTEFLLSPFAQMAIRQDTLSIPARKSAAEWTGEEREGLQRPKRYQLFREIVPTYRLFTDLHINHKQLLQVVREAKLYWSRLQDEETLCRRIEEELNHNKLP